MILFFVSCKENTIVENTNTKLFSYTISPNPCYTNANLLLRLVEDGHLTVKIFDTHYRELFTVVDFNASSGRQEFNINVSSLPAGAYECHVYALNEKAFIPFLVIR